MAGRRVQHKRHCIRLLPKLPHIAETQRNFNAGRFFIPICSHGLLRLLLKTPVNSCKHIAWHCPLCCISRKVDTKRCPDKPWQRPWWKKSMGSLRICIGQRSRVSLWLESYGMATSRDHSQCACPIGQAGRKTLTWGTTAQRSTEF